MLRDSGVTVYEGDIRPPERYLMERFITAPVWVEGETRGSQLVNARMKPNPDYRPPLKWVSLDIETSRHGELYCIGLEGCGQRVVYMLGPEPETPPDVDFELVFIASRPLLLEKQRTVCRTRPRRADRLERSAVRSARSAKARRTLSYPAAARPRQQRAGVA